MKNTLITFFFLLIINHLNAQKTAPSNIKSIQFQSLNKTTFNHILLGNLRFEFKGFNPPAENIAKMIWNILREKLSSNFGLEIILAETDKNKAINNGK